MNSKSQVSLLELEPQEIKHAKVISGVSPYVLRRVFGFWVVFVAAIGGLVTVAPDLSQTFITMTLVVLLLFTFLIFYQSRIAEGWPSVIHYHNAIGVVQDPVARRFLFVADNLVTDAKPHVLTPNKKAVAIHFDDSQLTDEDKSLLQQAIWPEDNCLIALSYFKKRENICATVKSVAGIN